MDKQDLLDFQSTVWEHYDRNMRDFPWRVTRDPYEILVSEVMLQQTQTYRVLPKYLAFLKEFPSVAALAQAPLLRVLACWQGLGYNRRALLLQKSCQSVVSTHGGVFPKDPKVLEALPGIGPYTSCAVATFAFDVQVPFIETNIRTVYLHHFFSGHDKVHDKDILALIEKTIDTRDVRNWYYALMDYGVSLKKKIKGINKKSVHYARQSTFEGSDRQIRGRIVKLLTKVTSVSRGELLSHLNRDEERVQNILARLMRDGLVAERDGSYFLP